MRAEKAPMAQCLVTEVAKPAKDSLTEVVRAAGCPAMAVHTLPRRDGPGSRLAASISAQA